jgi:uroporphyrinogen-III synthase
MNATLLVVLVILGLAALAVLIFTAARALRNFLRLLPTRLPAPPWLPPSSVCATVRVGRRSATAARSV